MNFRSLTGAPLVLFASLGIATSASAGDDRGASGRGDDTSLLERANKKEADGEPVAQAGSQQRPQGQPQGSPTGQGGPPAGAPAGAGPPFGGGKPVFDETWASIGIGAGLVPSYSGSDDYTFFPLPLIVGRVGGIGISPNGPGFVLDLNSAAPSMGPRSTSVSFGPAFRIRNDRVAQIEDEVVEQLEDLDLAIEVGGNVGVSIPGILNQFDSVRLSTQVRWDIAGAHDGMLIEPSIGYTTP
ncbi:MAG: MipA/OmpV family protein, partial [Pseudomonadota bacterium]